MPEAVIVDVVRTAGGRRNGALAGWHPVDLAAETLKALTERIDIAGQAGMRRLAEPIDKPREVFVLVF